MAGVKRNFNEIKDGLNYDDIEPPAAKRTYGQVKEKCEDNWEPPLE